ncbi:hypothetical protein G4Z16_01400 [Streptomyces bathyalis]|uniref:Uncharacterized protein n=1 Tax=Streptomyces bathyalis TaxID=2710756 RepID=A0A7T1WQJ7_9ACTN|nr:hypothetical protein [Streptomyces bathyalis]QPP05261.1 hypothetical protein G4Z16_01400 [Streptomyces bathyalis]
MGSIPSADCPLRSARGPLHVCRYRGTDRTRTCKSAADLCLDGAGFDKLWRFLFAVVLVGTFGRIVTLAPTVELPATLAWLVLSWRAGHREAADATAKDAEPARPAAPYRPTPKEMATALHKFADSHVHLVPIAVALRTTTGVVREVLTEMGCRLRVVSACVGGAPHPVRRTDLPPLPAPLATPSVVDVVAGHASNNNRSNALVSRTQWGCDHPESRRSARVPRHEVGGQRR